MYPGEKVKNTSFTVAIGISFKRLANTPYPIFGSSFSVRVGPRESLDLQKKLGIHV